MSPKRAAADKPLKAQPDITPTLPTQPDAVAAMDDALETVILVDAFDRRIGLAPKLETHQRGWRHRAISVLVANGAGEMLLQRRALGKYHSGGLWTNACCSHPRAGEASEPAASRRLHEEMGFTAPLEPLYVAAYRAAVGAGMIEDEVVHVFGAVYDPERDGPVAPNPSEAMDFAWRPLEAVEQDLGQAPEAFTEWFRIYLAEHRADIRAFLERAGDRG